MLGVVATLWATLVGQTVPDMLRDEKAPVRDFRAAAGRICAPRGQRVAPGAPVAPPTKADADFYAQTVPRFRDVWLVGQVLVHEAPDFAALAPPQVYAIDYRAFRDRIDTAIGDLAAVIAAGSERARERRVRAAYADLDAAVTRAREMKVPNCPTVLTNFSERVFVASLPNS